MLDRTEPLVLAPLLDDIATGAHAAAAARDIRVRLDVLKDVITEGDPFLLRRAVSNLVDNAIDFSPPGGEVLLTLDTTQKKLARISVRDHGRGIPEYAKDKVFEKFYSLARPHSQKKSTGLGLAFVKEIASLHRGRIELGNANGGGALATLTLPLSYRARGSSRIGL